MTRPDITTDKLLRYILVAHGRFVKVRVIGVVAAVVWVALLFKTNEQVDENTYSALGKVTEPATYPLAQVGGDFCFSILSPST